MEMAKKEASVHGDLFAKEILNGRTIALCGVWLWLGGPLLGFIGSMVGSYRQFNALAEQGLSNPGAVAAGISLSMKATALGQDIGSLGIIFLMISLFYYKYRARWLYRCLIVIAILCSLAFPFGTFLGIILLILIVAQKGAFHQDEI